MFLPANTPLTVAVGVRTAESVSPGRYWVDIMAENATSGQPVPRALDAVEVQVEGVSFAVLPLTRTKFTASPTWAPIDVIAATAQPEE